MNSVYTLNESGSFIWEQIDGVKDVEEIISALTTEYDIDFDNASKDMFNFIDKMSNYLIIKH